MSSRSPAPKKSRPGPPPQQTLPKVPRKSRGGVTVDSSNPEAKRAISILDEIKKTRGTSAELAALNKLGMELMKLDERRIEKIPATFSIETGKQSRGTGTKTITHLRNAVSRRLLALSGEPGDKKSEGKKITVSPDDARTFTSEAPEYTALEDLILQQSLRGLENKAKQQRGPTTALTVPIPSGDDRDTFNTMISTPITPVLDSKHNATALVPTTIAPTTIAPPPPSLTALDRKKGNYKPIREYNQFMTRVKKLEIAPEDYLRNLDIDQLKNLPPKVAEDPAFKPMIKERIKKLTKKQQAQEKLLYEKELEAQKKIEASKQEFDEQHGTDDFNIAPSELSIRNIDHMNPIMMRQFQFTDPNNIPQMAKELQEKDTLRRATRIKVYDDEPKTTDKAGEKLERSMKQRLRKPKVKFEPSNEQRQPLESFQVTNRGESGLDASEMYELLGFRADGSRDENTEATLRYIRDRY